MFINVYKKLIFNKLKLFLCVFLLRSKTKLHTFATEIKTKRTNRNDKVMIDARTNLPENANTQVVVQCSMNDLRDLLREAVLLNDEKQSAATPTDETEYLTTDQTATRLGVNRSTLWRWHKDGYLCHSKVGHKCLYKATDVASILKIEKD